MSDCCTPGTGFPNAALMQQMATNNAVVWEEICDIQQGILAASSQCQIGGGQMCTTIGGTTPMTFISGVMSVTVTAPGAGYIQDSPTVSFVPPRNSTGSGATGTLTTNGGNITSINITNGGTGYQPIPATLAISSATGSNAILQPLVDASGSIVSVNIINGGTGYVQADSIVATRAVAPDAAYVDATFVIAGVSLTGEILSIWVTQPGSGYQPSVATVNIVSTLNPTISYPLGTGFIANVLTDSLGAITGVVITNAGWGYAVMNPYLVISDPGTGATTQVNLSGNTVGSVTVLTPGSNYTQNATGTIFNPSTAGLLTITPPAGAPAAVAINVSNNTFGTNPQAYWNVWAGASTDKQISTQLNSVVSYFKNLGYTITIQSNPATGNTISWRLCW